MTTMTLDDTTTTGPAGLLRTSLAVDAEVTAVWAVACIALAGVLDEPLGIPAAAMVAVGVASLAGAGLLWWLRGRRPLTAAHGRVAVVGNTVLALVGAEVVVFVDGLTTAGRVAVGLSAAVIADFAIVEWLGARRLSRPRG